MRHQSPRFPLPHTIHVTCPMPLPPKEWPVISMVKFNPIHLNMLRQGSVGTRASFITPRFLLLPCIVLFVCACMTASQICLEEARERWWEHNVIGKAIEYLSLHQAVWDYDFPPSVSVSVRQQQGTAVAVSSLSFPPWVLFTPLRFSIGNFRVTMGPSGR